MSRRCSPSCGTYSAAMPSPSRSSTMPGRGLAPSAPARPCADRPNSTPGAIPTSISAATATIGSVLTVEHRAAAAMSGVTLELAQRDDALALQTVRADPLPDSRVEPISVDQRITAALADGGNPRPFSELRASCRVHAHHSLRTSRGNDRSGPRRQIRRRILPRRSLIAPTDRPALRPAAAILRIRYRQSCTGRAARRRLPTSASHTLYRTREAEAGSPSNAAIREPSDIVIVLIHGTPDRG